MSLYPLTKGLLYSKRFLHKYARWQLLKLVCNNVFAYNEAFSSTGMLPTSNEMFELTEEGIKFDLPFEEEKKLQLNRVNVITNEQRFLTDNFS